MPSKEYPTPSPQWNQLSANFMLLVEKAFLFHASKFSLQFSWPLADTLDVSLCRQPLSTEPTSCSCWDCSSSHLSCHIIASNMRSTLLTALVSDSSFPFLGVVNKHFIKPS